MNKETIHFFWYGTLSKLGVSCIKSFIDNGFEVNLWSYSNIEVSGAISRNANEILDETFINKFKVINLVDGKQQAQSDLASFSDFFRIAVLAKFGGWWADCDVYCLKPQEYFYNLRKNKQAVISLEGSNVIHCLGTGIMYMTETFAKQLKDYQYSYIEKHNFIAKRFIEFGPELLLRYVSDNDLYDNVIDSFNLFPIDFSNKKLFLIKDKETVKSLIKDALAVHIWTACLSEFDLNIETCPEFSLLYEFITGTYYNNTLQSPTNKILSMNHLNRITSIKNLYKKILKRNADVSGLQHYVNSSFSIEEIKNQLLNCEEYRNLRHISREEMLKFLPSGHCAEIGVLRGEYSDCILEKNQPQKLHLIDVWANIELNYYDDNMTDNAAQNVIYNYVKNKFGKLDNVNIIKALSTEAANQFDNESLDWVYIDADHSFEGCYNDLVAYDSKVKINGYICGHDWLPSYFFRDGFGVNEAVLKFVEETGYILSYITDEPEYKSYVISKSKEAHDNLLFKMQNII